MNMTAVQPSLGSVYYVPYNDSVVNFTFVYPANYAFYKLSIRFSLYDFTSKINPSNFNTYNFSWVDFYNSNISLPWVVPPTILQPGDYIMGCFEWLQTNASGVAIADTFQCKLTRTTMNSTILPIANTTIGPVVVTGTNISITTVYPLELPYNNVGISSALNGTILGSMSRPTSNQTTTAIYAFSYTNLTSNMAYNLCIYMNYSNSMVNGSQTLSTQCQIVTISGGNPPIGTSTNAPNVTHTNSSNRIKVNFCFIILLFISMII
jgi:hypothetical protein